MWRLKHVTNNNGSLLLQAYFIYLIKRKGCWRTLLSTTSLPGSSLRKGEHPGNEAVLSAVGHLWVMKTLARVSKMWGFWIVNLRVTFFFLQPHYASNHLWLSNCLNLDLSMILFVILWIWIYTSRHRTFWIIFTFPYFLPRTFMKLRTLNRLKWRNGG